MNRRKWLSQRFLLTIFSLLVLCAGCDPTDWVYWAPDGEHAFVQGADNNTFLIDRTGKIVGKATDARAWLPDSRRVVAVHTVKPASWDEYAQLLGPDRSEKVVKASASLVEVIKAYHGDWSKFGESPEYKKWESEEVGQIYNPDWLPRSVALYLKQTNPKLLVPIFSTNSISVTDYIPDIYELAVRQILPSAPPSEQLLAQFPDKVKSVWVSPTGQALAFAVEEPGRPALYVIANSENHVAVLVDTGVAEAAWSTDGQNLVYPKTTGPHENMQQLGTITSRRICGTNGQILATFENPRDLAGLILDQSPTRVACLPDGRILFAAAPIHLPAVTADLPGHLTLFAIRPAPTPSLESIVRPADIAELPDRVDRFSLSPDKTRVSIVDSQGNVSVLSLKTGELRPVQPAVVYTNTDKYTQLIPVWRTTNEVTCLVPIGDPSGSTARVEVVLENLNGQKTAISLSWSNAPMKGLLLPSE
jgi:hypothetical protein